MKALSTGEYQKCYEQALDITSKKIAGEKPVFLVDENDDYPPYVIRIVVFLSIAVLIAAFIPSALRLYSIGRETFNLGGSSVVGFSIVVLAEMSLILFSVAYVIFKELSQASKLALWSSMFLSAALALSGNYYVALYNRPKTLFSVLEAFAPTLLTLATSFILKELFLNSINERQKAKTAYISELEKWNKKVSGITEQSEFKVELANVVWKKIAAKNKLDPDEFTNEQAREMVLSEYRAHNRFDDIDLDGSDKPKENKSKTDVDSLVGEVSKLTETKISILKHIATMGDITDYKQVVETYNAGNAHTVGDSTVRGPLALYRKFVDADAVDKLLEILGLA